MESKYQYTEKCREISGFGGSYEEASRKMVTQGLEWLDRHKEDHPDLNTPEAIETYNLDVTDDAKSLKEAMLVGFSGISDEMINTAVNHVLVASQLGWDKYIEQMEQPLVVNTAPAMPTAPEPAMEPVNPTETASTEQPPVDTPAGE